MMFDTDPDAMFWCEGLAAYYLAYYGIHYTSLPQRALYTANLTKINFSSVERAQLANFITNIFTCDFDQLPSHVLVHPTLSCSRSHAETWRCLSPGSAHRVCGGPGSPAVTCGCLTEQARARGCPRVLADVRELVRRSFGTGDIEVTLADIVEQLAPSCPGGERINVSLVVEHEICVERLKRRNEECFKESLNRCRSSRLHVLETNRITMDDLEPAILANPDLYVIHYVRDPRAIAFSRLERGWTVDHGRSGVVAETRFLCGRMRSDLRQRRVLERRYPGVILGQRYEDLVVDPVGTARQAYGHMSREFPGRSQWPEFAAEALHAREDGDHMSVFRTNATGSIHKWRDHLSHEERGKLKDIGCEDVLTELGYSLD